jgi:hypothetical protein
MPYVTKCPTYLEASDVGGVGCWYLEAIFLMRSLKANSDRIIGVEKLFCLVWAKFGLFELGTICSSFIDPVSPSLSVLFEDELNLLLFCAGLNFVLFLFFSEVNESSNMDGPEKFKISLR